MLGCDYEDTATPTCDFESPKSPCTQRLNDWSLDVDEVMKEIFGDNTETSVTHTGQHTDDCEIQAPLQRLVSTIAQMHLPPNDVSPPLEAPHEKGQGYSNSTETPNDDTTRKSGRPKRRRRARGNAHKEVAMVEQRREKITFGVDSGAELTVITEDAASEYPTTNDGTRIKMRDCQGNTIKDLGKKILGLKTNKDATRTQYTNATVGPLRKTLMAVCSLVDAGHRVVFDPMARLSNTKQHATRPR